MRDGLKASFRAEAIAHGMRSYIVVPAEPGKDYRKLA